MYRTIEEIKECFREIMGTLSLEEIVSNEKLKERLEGFNAVLVSK